MTVYELFVLALFESSLKMGQSGPLFFLKIKVSVNVLLKLTGFDPGTLVFELTTLPTVSFVII